jgi:hypothetical protein
MEDEEIIIRTEISKVEIESSEIKEKEMIAGNEIDIEGPYPVVVEKLSKEELKYPKAALIGVPRFDTVIDINAAAAKFHTAQLSRVELFDTYHRYVRGIVTREGIQYYFTAKVNTYNFHQNDMEDLISYAILKVDQMVGEEKRANTKSKDDSQQPT